MVCAGTHWAQVRSLVPDAPAPWTVLHFTEAGIMPDTSGPPAYHISTDHLRAAYQATTHLVEQGHRRIAFVGVHPRRDGPGPFREPVMENMAFAGFLQALRTSRIDDYRAFAYYGGVAVGDSEVAAFLDSLGGWPTAFLFSADFRAASLYHAATVRGLRIPEDLSAVGIGDTPWSQVLRPQLTTVSLDETEMARLAIQACQAEAPKTARTLYVAPHLVQRDSVQALPEKEKQK